MKDIALSSIRTDGGTQTRAELDADTIEAYAAAMQEGAEFPPAVVFYDGTNYWMADGFHRAKAREQRGCKTIRCDVRQGTQRDAILYSVGANGSHGLRRSNADKRRAVETLLNDPEWAKWSDRKIAVQCGVSQPFVGSLRETASDNRYQIDRTFTRGGTTATMNTANIGRSADPFSSGSSTAVAEPVTEDKDAAAAARRAAADAMETLSGYRSDDEDEDEPENNGGEDDDVSTDNDFTTTPPARRAEKTAVRTDKLDALKALIEDIYKVTRKPWSQVSTIDLKNKIAELRDAVGEL